MPPRTTTPGRNPMRAPPSGVTIRMYRQGHGDCFLLCFRRSPEDDTPYFVLIDCGMKSRSNVLDDIGTDEVILDIAKATGGHPGNGTKGRIDLAIVTHEHEDHVSGFPVGFQDDGQGGPKKDREKFEGHPLVQNLEIDRLWLAWTEDPEDCQANALRREFEDELITLAFAASEMKRLGMRDAPSERVRYLLEAETGFADVDEFLADLRKRLGITAPPSAGQDGLTALFAADKPKGYKYKIRLAGLRQLVGEDRIDYLDPEAGAAWEMPGVQGVKVYPLGPPRNEKLLKSANPRRSEEFRVGGFGSVDAGFGLSDPGFGLYSALCDRAKEEAPTTPFAARYHVAEAEVEAPPKEGEDNWRSLLDAYYGNPDGSDVDEAQRRQIGAEWLGEADSLALRINNEVNNTSLVLAFELPATGKTLLFTGDAQRGSWISWSDLTFGERSARALLGDCVFYKAGHHGSHNATLKGTAADDYANLDWLAQGARAAEFTAMIPTNKVWAFGKSRPWKHPLPAIEKALIEKASGRVMMTSDTKIMLRPPLDQPEYRAQAEEFEDRTKLRRHYIEYWVPDV